MFQSIRITLKKLFSDKRGEDFTDASSAFSRVGKGLIGLGAVAAFGTGVAAGSTATNNTTQEAQRRVQAPVGVDAPNVDPSKPVYKQ